MSNILGNRMTITLFGESHGEAVGCVLDGLPAGIKLDEAFLKHQMGLRRAFKVISTGRRELDEVQFVSGVFEGYTTGSPLTIMIKNTDAKSSDYAKMKDIPRPSHADYVADIAYEGYQDYRGGGHFSGRLTAPLVAAGAIAMMLLRDKGIVIGSHILEVNGIKDKAFEGTLDEIDKVKDEYFAVLDKTAGEQMIKAIEEARDAKDSLGGIIETEVLNYPIGMGSPTFGSMESELAKAIFAIGGVKGIEFGDGFDLARMKGSEANDAYKVIDHKVMCTTNHNGGINGGISNGMPIRFKTVIKPTSSIGLTQQSFNMRSLQECELSVSGRHDPCIVHRVRVVIDSLTAWVLCDRLLESKGYAYFSKGRKECRE